MLNTSIHNNCSSLQNIHPWMRQTSDKHMIKSRDFVKLNFLPDSNNPTQNLNSNIIHLGSEMVFRSAKNISFIA